jgi:Piwi domain.
VPVAILMYRDGVGEGQINQVIEHELDQIQVNIIYTTPSYIIELKKQVLLSFKGSLAKIRSWLHRNPYWISEILMYLNVYLPLNLNNESELNDHAGKRVNIYQSIT